MLPGKWCQVLARFWAVAWRFYLDEIIIVIFREALDNAGFVLYIKSNVLLNLHLSLLNPGNHDHEETLLSVDLKPAPFGYIKCGGMGAANL